MKSFTELLEGVYDPNIFKAFFMAGGPGSGKSYVAGKTTAGQGLKVVNSDDVFERYLKLAKLSFEMPETQKSKRDERRQAAKTVTSKRQANYIEGRLGMVIDGTGKDYGKISSQAAGLRQIGYDTYMIFVNTSLDVALERNAKRDRTVPEYITRKSWSAVQANIGRFQNLYGMSNMIIVDNSKNEKELTTIVMNKVDKSVRRLLGNKIQSYTAKRWMATERKLKRRT